MEGEIEGWSKKGFLKFAHGYKKMSQNKKSAITAKIYFHGLPETSYFDSNSLTIPLVNEGSIFFPNFVKRLKLHTLALYVINKKSQWILEKLRIIITCVFRSC